MMDLELGPLALGQQFLKYEIRSLLGKGGHAFVYEGYDAFLDRTVAIKVIPGSRESGRDLARRAQAEARALVRIDHENVVRVFDAGGTDAGLVYLIMERLAGRTLRDALIEQKQLAVCEALSLAIQIADGVVVAHREGVIHRDLKPENVFVVTDNRVKVLDFGIAKVLGYGADTTQKDLLQGTVLYMSPEQLQGFEISPRSDIFSLGTLLFEALFRHPVLLGGGRPTLQEAGWIQIARVPEPLNQLDPRIPAYVAEFVQRAIQKRPEDRYDSMEAVARAAREVRERFLADGRRLGIPIPGRDLSRAQPQLSQMESTLAAAINTIADRPNFSSDGSGFSSAAVRDAASESLQEREQSLPPDPARASAERTSERGMSSLPDLTRASHSTPLPVARSTRAEAALGLPIAKIARPALALGLAAGVLGAFVFPSRFSDPSRSRVVPMSAEVSAQSAHSQLAAKESSSAAAARPAAVTNKNSEELSSAPSAPPAASSSEAPSLREGTSSPLPKLPDGASSPLPKLPDGASSPLPKLPDGASSPLPRLPDGASSVASGLVGVARPAATAASRNSPKATTKPSRSNAGSAREVSFSALDVRLEWTEEELKAVRRKRSPSPAPTQSPITTQPPF